MELHTPTVACRVEGGKRQQTREGLRQMPPSVPLRIPAWLAFVPVMIACGDAAYGGPRAASPELDKRGSAPNVVRPLEAEAPPLAATYEPVGSAHSDTALSPTHAPSAIASVGALGGLEHPRALHHFFEALAVIDEGRGHDDVHVVQFGDSHTAADFETGPLRRWLQTRFGDGGRGFVSVGKPWRYYVQEGIRLEGMSGWTAERGAYDKGRFIGDGMYGLVGVSIAASQKGARAWTDLSVRAARIELAYLEQIRGGSFDWLVDGVRVKRVATHAASGGAAYASIEVSDLPHQVELQAVGDGAVRVFGMSLDSRDVGVTLDAFGVNGARIVNMLTWDEAQFTEQLRHRSPDLVVLAFGTNESCDDTPLEIYERQIVDVLGRVARSVPAASCLLLGPPDRATRIDKIWTTVPRLLDIIASQRRVAEAAGCAYYSQFDRMGGAGSIAAWALETPPRATSDRTHLSRDGYAELGDAVAKDLVAAYEAWRADNGRPALPARPRSSAEPVADRRW
jgi:lysophospholipase L1-like esterase